MPFSLIFITLMGLLMNSLHAERKAICSHTKHGKKKFKIMLSSYSKVRQASLPKLLASLSQDLSMLKAGHR